MQNFRSTLVLFSFSLVCSQSAWSDLSQTADPIMIEAENFASQRNDDVRQWKVLSEDQDDESITVVAKDAGDGRFVRVLPDTRVTHADKLIKGTNFSPEPGKMAILSYPVEIKTPGRYYVWVRAYSSGSEDNGIHVGLDGNWPESGQRMQWCQGKNSWRWQCAQRTDENHCGEPMKIYLDIEEPGSHTIEFSMREDGFTMDRFLLTTDKTHQPE